MSSASLQRRQFLKALGVGVGAAALPFHSLLERSVVQAGPEQPPLRLLLLLTGWGGSWDYMRPTGVTGAETALTPDMLNYSQSILQPLSAFTSKMLVLEGLATTAALIPSDPAQPVASRTLYLGHEHIDLNRYTGSVANDANGDHLPTSASLDYVLGKQLGGSNAVRSLQLGIGCSSGAQYTDTLSFNESGQRLPGISDPVVAFKTLFGDVGTTPPPDPAAAQRALARQKSVVAALQASANRLRGRLAGEEQAKLDEHLAALHDIEARLTSPGYTPVSCGTPTPPPGTAPPVSSFGGSDAVPANTSLHFDILAQAFACDRTRYVAARWGENLDGPIPYLFGTDVAGMHGDVAHVAGDTGPAGDLARQRLAKVNNWYAQRLAEFCTRLQSIPEGGGTLLDNTLIVWSPDFGPDVHGGLNLPHILLGGAQGRFRMGRYLNFAKADPSNPGWTTDPTRYVATNHLLVSLMNACGLPGSTFGATEFVGPLSGLT
jgi:Protein of unknown function (DUF1552)